MISHSEIWEIHYALKCLEFIQCSEDFKISSESEKCSKAYFLQLFVYVFSLCIFVFRRFQISPESEKCSKAYFLQLFVNVFSLCIFVFIFDVQGYIY